MRMNVGSLTMGCMRLPQLLAELYLMDGYRGKDGAIRILTW